MAAETELIRMFIVHEASGNRYDTSDDYKRKAHPNDAIAPILLHECSNRPYK